MRRDGTRHRARNRHRCLRRPTWRDDTRSRRISDGAGRRLLVRFPRPRARPPRRGRLGRCLASQWCHRRHRGRRSIGRGRGDDWLRRCRGCGDAVAPVRHDAHVGAVSVARDGPCRIAVGGIDHAQDARAVARRESAGHNDPARHPDRRPTTDEGDRVTGDRTTLDLSRHKLALVSCGPSLCTTGVGIGSLGFPYSSCPRTTGSFATSSYLGRITLHEDNGMTGKERRTRPTVTWLSPSERDEVAGAATEDARSVSAYLRQLALDDIARRARNARRQHARVSEGDTQP